MNTPTLRFKEFSGAWEDSSIGDLINEKSAKFNPEKHGDKFKCIELEHLSQETGELLGYVNASNQKSIKNKFDKGDVLFGKLRPYLKKFLKAPFDGVCSTEIWVLKGKKLSNEFLYQFVQTEQFLTLTNISSGSKMPRADWGIVSSAVVPTPTLPEQTKIANFLTAIDEKIAQLSQTAQLLTDYKKGVMQQIFSQQLRFKDDDGREFAEWDFIELEKVAFKVNAKNKDCSITNVLTNSATQGIVNQADYFDRDIANQNNLGGYYVVEIDDFVYNPRISNHALVGSLKRNNLVKGVMSPLYTVFRFKNGSLPFFEQYFETTHWHDYMKSVANSGARHDRLNITNDDFLNLPVPFPSLPEQTKIANFLTAIDDKINNNQTQLDAMKQYKSGLLQQMFV